MFVKHKVRIVGLLTIVLSIVNLYSLYQTFNNATSNDECLWIPKKYTSKKMEIFFDKVKVNGVTYNAGIRNGDKLISINGVEIESTVQAQVLLNTLGLGDYAKYSVERDQKIFNTNVYIKKLVNPTLLGNALYSLFFLLIGFIVFKAKPSGGVQLLFYLLGAFVSVASSMNGVLTNIKFDDPGILFQGYVFVWILSFCFMPAIYIHFFLVFPTRLKIIDKKWFLALLYGISVVLIIISFYHAFFYVFKDAKFNINGIGVISNRISFYQITALITGFITLIVRSIKTKGNNRKPLLIILTFYIIGFLGLTFTLLIAPIISDTIYNSPEYYMPVILVAAIPLGFAYAIFKYQLMDVGTVVRNTIFYGAATITIAVSYFLAVYALGQIIGTSIGTEYKNFIAAATFLVFALVFQSTKDKFQDYLTRRFYPEQFAYQEILIKFSQELSGTCCFDQRLIIDSASNTFVNALKLNKFGIILINYKNSEHYLSKSIGINSELALNHEDAVNINHYVNSTIGINNKFVIEEVNFNYLLPSISTLLFHESIFTVIPLVANSKAIGLLLFGLKYSGSKFSNKDIELLNAASNQVAISIENARLYEAEAEKVKLEQELDFARNIQQGLLPKSIPDIKGLDIFGKMIPAMQVGGDYYDLIKLSDKKLIAIVGDVSGKGLSAALYMAKLQTILQLHCLEGKSAKEILKEVNKKVYEAVERNWFVTVNFVLIDLEKMRVNYCRAGHSPLLVTLKGKSEEIKPKGLAIGLDKGDVFDSSIEEVEVEIEKGTVLTIISDGVTELFNEKVEMYNSSRLIETINDSSEKNSEEIFNTLFNSLNAFKGKAEQSDDITAVIIKVL
jgi:sigma-B regulation protein RsbU (phosphoserine phosphatase)